jgi:hypothetical protein
MITVSPLYMNDELAGNAAMISAAFDLAAPKPVPMGLNTLT